MRASRGVLKEELGEAFRADRCLIFPLGEGYFEGVKGIVDFSKKSVVLRFGEYLLMVEGEDLSVGKYIDGDLYLRGKIQSVKAEQPR